MSKVLKVVSNLMLVMAFLACCTPEEPNHGDDNVVDGHEYVDLGLPSGTLWATCNVGAESPESFGDYFAWGESNPKEMYDWKQYKYATFSNGEFLLNKYCSDTLYGLGGYVDTLTVLESVDDVVKANWGEGWRMATKEEWDELYKHTTVIWTTQENVDGLLLTSWNGNSMFLPAAGYHWEDEWIGTPLGIYWTSTLQTELPIIAWSFHFNLDGCHVCGSYERARGQVVRAVCAER